MDSLKYGGMNNHFMDITHFIKNGRITVKVIPNSKQTKIVEDNGLRIHIKAVPEDNKANLELVKFFKKEFGLRVEIVKGLRSRVKVLEVKR